MGIRCFISVLIALVVVNCGGASGTGSSSSSTDSGSSSTGNTTNSDGTITTDTTVSALLEGGIQVDDVESVLTGTWKIKNYDLGETDSIVETEVDDEEIVFNDDALELVMNLESGQTILTDYEASPLYSYPENTVSIEENFSGEEYDFAFCDDPNNQVCDDCGEHDTYCVRVTDPGEPNDEGQIFYGYSHIPEEDEVAHGGIYDAILAYEVNDTAGPDKILKFTITGYEYHGCSGSYPDACWEDSADSIEQADSVEHSLSYLMKAVTEDMMVIEDDSNYIVLIKE